MGKFVPAKEVVKIFKVHYDTLYKLEREGLIEVVKTPGGKRLYNIAKFIKENKINGKEMDKTKRKICYCRVSSKKQAKDLERQVKYMQEKYPKHEIIKDIGSGLNFKRKGLREIIGAIMREEIKEIVVTYKDRLCRFGYELIEWMVEEFLGGKIKVENEDEEETPQQEIAKDILQIMNVYVAKINGLRKYKKKMINHINEKNNE